jgi:hypothetical protein
MRRSRRRNFKRTARNRRRGGGFLKTLMNKTRNLLSRPGESYRNAIGDTLQMSRNLRTEAKQGFDRQFGTEAENEVFARGRVLEANNYYTKVAIRVTLILPGFENNEFTTTLYFNERSMPTYNELLKVLNIPSNNFRSIRLNTSSVAVADLTQQIPPSNGEKIIGITITGDLSTSSAMAVRNIFTTLEAKYKNDNAQTRKFGNQISGWSRKIAEAGKYGLRRVARKATKIGAFLTGGLLNISMLLLPVVLAATALCLPLFGTPALVGMFYIHTQTKNTDFERSEDDTDFGIEKTVAFLLNKETGLAYWYNYITGDRLSAQETSWFIQELENAKAAKENGSPNGATFREIDPSDSRKLKTVPSGILGYLKGLVRPPPEEDEPGIEMADARYTVGHYGDPVVGTVINNDGSTDV